MFPIPETSRWLWSASPSQRSPALRSLRDNRVDVELRPEHVRAELGEAPPSSVSTGPFHCTASSSAPRRTSHGSPAREVPRGVDPPAPVHPQVAADDEPALEAKQQVLPDGLDRLEHAPVHGLGNTRRLSTRIRRRRLEPLTDERLQAPGGAVERITLWHLRRVALPGYCERNGERRHVHRPLASTRICP